MKVAAGIPLLVLSSLLFKYGTAETSFEKVGHSFIKESDLSITIDLNLSSALIALRILRHFSQISEWLDAELCSNILKNLRTGGTGIKQIVDSSTDSYFTDSEASDIQSRNLVQYNVLYSRLQNVLGHYSLAVKGNKPEEESLVNNPIWKLFKKASVEAEGNITINSLGLKLKSIASGSFGNEKFHIRYDDNDITTIWNKVGKCDLGSCANFSSENLVIYRPLSFITERYVKVIDFLKLIDGTNPKNYWKSIVYTRALTRQTLEFGYPGLSDYIRDLEMLISGSLSVGLFDQKMFEKLKIVFEKFPSTSTWAKTNIHHLDSFPFSISKTKVSANIFCENCTKNSIDLSLTIHIPLARNEQFEIFRHKTNEVLAYDSDTNRALSVEFLPRKEYQIVSDSSVIQLSNNQFRDNCNKIAKDFFCSNVVSFDKDGDTLLPDVCLNYIYSKDIQKALKACLTTVKNTTLSIVGTRKNNYRITNVNPVSLTYIPVSGNRYMKILPAGQSIIKLNSSYPKIKSRYFTLTFNPDLEYVTSDEIQEIGTSQENFEGGKIIRTIGRALFEHLVSTPGYEHLSTPVINFEDHFLEPLYYLGLIGFLTIIVITLGVCKASKRILDPNGILTLWISYLPCCKLFNRQKVKVTYPGTPTNLDKSCNEAVSLDDYGN